MRLFKRKAETDDAPRCPACGERVPQGVDACAMCGHDFAIAPPSAAGRSREGS